MATSPCLPSLVERLPRQPGRPRFFFCSRWHPFAARIGPFFSWGTLHAPGDRRKQFLVIFLPSYDSETFYFVIDPHSQRSISAAPPSDPIIGLFSIFHRHPSPGSQAAIIPRAQGSFFYPWRLGVGDSFSRLLGLFGTSRCCEDPRCSFSPP